MIDRTFAQRFATEWVDSWNSHDLERVLAHYADEFEMSSPFIVEWMGEPSGRLKGKDKIRYELGTGPKTAISIYNGGSASVGKPISAHASVRRAMEIPFLDLEKVVLNQQIAFRSD